MTDIKTYCGSLYHYGGGTCYCGVLITESVMRKLAKLQQKHLDEVKLLLSNEVDKGNVFSYDWTLHYPEGKQTEVTYIDESVDIKERILLSTRHDKPEHKPLVFIGDRDSVVNMADAKFNLEDIIPLV